MTKSAETAAIIALLRSKAVRWNQLAEMVEEEGSAIAILERALAKSEATLFDDPDPAPPADLDAIIHELGEWEAEGMDLVTVLDDAYPANLRSVHDRPPLLFVRGALDETDEQS